MTPLSAEARARYPSNWKAIRTSILERAGHKCECCGIPNGLEVVRDPRHAEAWFEASYFWDQVAGGSSWVMDVADQFGENENGTTKLKSTKIVLTIAHLDHTPENNDPANLAALCQRCHLRYDSELHQNNARKTRARKKGEIDMLTNQEAAK